MGRVRMPKIQANHVTAALALLLIVGFSVAYVVMAVRNYADFETGIDLAGYGQALYHLSHGRLPFNTFKQQVLWGDHAHFILVLLAPLYRLVPDVRLLLVVQALAATTSGWALYAVAKDAVKNSLFALSALYAYLAFVGIQYALDFDFHPSVLTGAALAWFVYGWYFKKWKTFWVALLLGLITREDAPTIFAPIALYFFAYDFLRTRRWFRKVKREQDLTKRWKVSLGSVAVSTVYFLIVAYGIMPLWTPGNIPLAYLDLQDDKTPWGIVRDGIFGLDSVVQNVFDNEIKQHTMNVLFQAFAYLPFLSPFTYAGVIPTFYARFNGGNEYSWVLTNHSNANVWPIMAFGAVFAAASLVWLLRQVKKEKIAFWTTLYLSLLLIISVHLTAWQNISVPLRVLGRELWYGPTKNQPERRAAFAEVAAAIPAEDGVAASSGFTAHLSNRNVIINYPQVPDEAKWVIVSGSPPVNTWPMTDGPMKEDIAWMLTQPRYELVKQVFDVYLFYNHGKGRKLQ